MFDDDHLPTPTTERIEQKLYAMHETLRSIEVNLRWIFYGVAILVAAVIKHEWF
ncbi:hypothetical protein N5K27_22405 [Pigmentiphaga sp. GD03639]|uniref:hypothetical protein n=1 Tax=Pigmentiphaga sp. GD03639 TaxID=2975354 RepID=UPI0024488AB3|nr:hypothetical protein [Pigmentiphaga sp. GD03639]MDH2239064.1 hypothetical protein [Pigmentiphaga sp. GD03639]